MKFRITWHDPETGEQISSEEEYHDTPAVSGVHAFVSAWDWANDAGYSYADKGPYIVEALR